MTYKEKLKNPKWQKKRLEILQRDEFKCCYCNDTETELQIHHLKYTKEPWKAPGDDLITLCKHCHSLIYQYKSLNVIFIEKNYYDSHDLVSLVVKHKEDNKHHISVYDINKEHITFIVQFLIGGKFHKSILKLTS